MSDQPKHRPDNCRNKLQSEGKSYPRSGCAACGNGGLAGCPYDQQGLADALALAEVRIKQLEAYCAALQRLAGCRREQRDALAAHVERWRAAYVKLTNRVEFADNGEGCYVADGALMHEFDAISGDTPTTSLARQKLLWQADVLEEYREELGSAGVAFVDCLAAKLRRQAEGGDQ